MSKYLKMFNNLSKEKKIAGFLTVFLLVAILGGLTFQKSFALDNIASGTSGDCDWVIDGNGKLTLKPSSSTADSCVLDSYTYPSTTSFPWYANRTNITSVVVEKGVSTSTGAAGLFNGLLNATNIDLKELKTTGTTDMSYMFNGCSSLTNLDLSSSNFNTSDVDTINRMFKDCTNLQELNLKNFDMTKVNNKTTGTATKYEYLFQNVGKNNKNGCKITLNSTFNNNGSQSQYPYTFPSAYYTKETNNKLGNTLFSGDVVYGGKNTLIEEERKLGSYTEQQINETKNYTISEPDDRNQNYNLQDILENSSFTITINGQTYSFNQSTDKTIAATNATITYTANTSLIELKFTSLSSFTVTYNYTKKSYVGNVTEGVTTWVPAYSVTYDKNGGDAITDTPNPQIYETGAEIDTSGYSATKSGYSLYSWNTVAEEPGTKVETSTIELNETTNEKRMYLTNTPNIGSTIDVTINGNTVQIEANHLKGTTIDGVRATYWIYSTTSRYISFTLTEGTEANLDISVKYDYGLPFNINKQSDTSFGDYYSKSFLTDGNANLYAQYIKNPNPTISGEETKIYGTGDNTT